MASLFTPENEGKLLNELKERGSGIHYMVLADHETQLATLMEKAGFGVKRQEQLDPQMLQVGRRKASWTDILAALKEFFTPGDDDEILVWRGIKTPLTVYNQYADQCVLLVDGDDIDNRPGSYPVKVMTAVT